MKLTRITSIGVEATAAARLARKLDLWTIMEKMFKIFAVANI